MSPPIPRDQWCESPIKKHDGTGRTTICALRIGHKDARHRDTEFIEMRRRTDTPERRMRYKSQNYGREHTWYAEQLARQNGGCAICGKTPEQNGRALAVDHDHACCPSKSYPAKDNACGKCVRGLLCNDCNQMLGRAKDSVSILTAAIAYLSQST